MRKEREREKQRMVIDKTEKLLKKWYTRKEKERKEGKTENEREREKQKMVNDRQKN